MDALSGLVERVTYYNPENGYSVIRINPDDYHGPGENSEGLITVTGNLPELSPGEYLRLHGEWINHPRHGLQFSIQKLEQAIPATLEGLKRYLGSGLLKGIGPKLAERIVKHFGEETIDVIENTPHRLREVQDIGKKRSKQIIMAWQEQKQVKEIMIFLHSHGITTNLAVKIYKHYGDEALDVVKNDPYQLARDLFGVGFKTADQIAQSLGLPQDHPTRIEAGIINILEEMIRDGHVYCPENKLITDVSELLAIDRVKIPIAIQNLTKIEMVVLDKVPHNEGEKESVVYQRPYYYAEVEVSNRFQILSNSFPSKLSDVPPSFVEISDALSDEQNQAVKMALSNPVSILTGGPGTGKTTTLKALISIMKSANKKFALSSPTGRAAKRLSEATEQSASTIHKLLEYSPIQGFGINDKNQLKVDIIIVDEASMLDLMLANNLLKALEPGTHLLLVGDIDQLPSVGAGDVLRDIITSQIAPVTRLSKIYRQAANSHIVKSAHKINQGLIPEFPEDSNDFFRFPAKDPQDAVNWVENLVVERIPKKFGFDPLKEIQVLVPMYRGPAGIHAINERLQNVLNPSSPLKPERKSHGQIFRSGDKVMQIKNDYQKQVFNGDIGYILDVSQIDHSMTIQFDGRDVLYDWNETDLLVLAYAISIHKAQGSEFPVIILPLLTQHYLMLQRNLLYTAVTRAKNLCILVTNKKTLSIAVKNNRVAERYSGLSYRLNIPQ